MPAPVWEGIAAQLTLLNQPLMAAFILISLVTYMRPSELVVLRCLPTARCRFSHVVVRREHSELECLPRQESAMGRSSWTNAGFNGSPSSGLG